MAVMDETKTQIVELKTKIANLEHELTAARRALFELEDSQPVAGDLPTAAQSSGQVVEGDFDGENMVGPAGKIFPVPANYASKSKLVEGDHLKLTINSDGTFLFKQIGPIQRKHLMGILKFENNTYMVESEGDEYHVLYASVTYHKVAPGDKVSIVVPAGKASQWAALEGVVHDVPTVSEPVAPGLVSEPETTVEAAPVAVAEAATQQPATLADLMSQASGSGAPAASTANLASETITLPATDDLASKFGIDDLKIVSRRQEPAPKAVDPSTIQVNAPSASAELIQVAPVVNTPISELEI